MEYSSLALFVSIHLATSHSPAWGKGEGALLSFYFVDLLMGGVGVGGSATCEVGLMSAILLNITRTESTPELRTGWDLV